MGTWGTAIFSDDLAADIRDNYRDHLGDGCSGREATDRLLAEYASSLKDPDEAPVFRLALAATQWKHGRLEDDIKAQAFDIIASGTDLKRWQVNNPKEAKKRAAVLEKLKLQLESPQPAAKRVPKRFVSTCDWKPGQVVAYRLTFGAYVLLLVVKLSTDRGGIHPVCALLDFTGSEVPSERTIQTLPLKERLIREEHHPYFDRPPHVFSIGCLSQREFPHSRVMPLQVFRSAPEKIWSSTICTWHHLDELLKRDYGLG